VQLLLVVLVPIITTLRSVIQSNKHRDAHRNNSTHAYSSIEPCDKPSAPAIGSKLLITAVNWLELAKPEMPKKMKTNIMTRMKMSSRNQTANVPVDKPIFSMTLTDTFSWSALTASSNPALLCQSTKSRCANLMVVSM
jgi:hypothetical protein